MNTREGPRKKLLELIGLEPGLHFRGIQRKTGYSIGQLEYHLYKLEREDQITVRKDGRFNRYFLSATSESEAKKLSFHIRNKTNRKVLLFMLRNGEMGMEELNIAFPDSDELQLALSQLYGDEVILWDHKSASVKNPKFVKNYIKRSKTMFMEELADSLIDLLDENE